MAAIALVLWFPAGASAFALLKDAAGWVLVPMLLVAGTSALRLSYFMCPRCGERFDGKTGNSLAFVSRCGHCGIEIGTPRGD
jgi:hypothetical protein